MKLLLLHVGLFFEKLWTAIKDYRYKMWTTMGIAIVSYTLSSFIDWNLFIAIGHLCVIGLSIFFFYMMLFHVTKNTWRDGSKVMAVIYGVLVFAMLVFVLYLIWDNVIAYTRFADAIWKLLH